MLWLRELSVLFGSTARSAAATLAAFFLGLAAGSAFWGRRASGLRNPVRAYALLEVGVALAALSYFAIFALYDAVYASLYDALGSAPVVFTAVKLALAIGLLSPAAFFMGGTWPVLGQAIVRSKRDLAPRAGLLYLVNTLGGALGVLAAGFFLPAALGFRTSYAVTVGATLAVAGAAWMAGRRFETPPGQQRTPAPAIDAASSTTPQLAPGLLLASAAASGFGALGLEVLWTRMFAQVLHNSVYSFALILAVFLVALALGAAVANLLVRRAADPVHTLTLLLLGAGVTVGLTPYVFHGATGGLGYVGVKAGWVEYLGQVAGTATLVMLTPALLVGTVFPYLLRLAEMAQGAGRTLGRLAAVNTLGAIAGSLLAGFVLLEWLGLWASVHAIAILYLALALVVSEGVPRLARIALGALVVLATVLDPSRLPVMPDRSAVGDPCVRDVWEGRDGTVSVVSVGDDLRLIVDNYYSLGGTGAARYEKTQGDLPMMLHPEPRSVFFLGLGTGITAGAALSHPVERVVVAELSANVIEAAREHFTEHTNGLFTDPRAVLVAEDGRNHLRGTREHFDVIVSDLFIPWQAGAGSLYTREHFEHVRARLAPGGVFAQWVPLYQVSRREMSIIVRTLLEVFPQVTLWRGDFEGKMPIAALVAQAAATQLDPEAVVAHFARRRKAAVDRETVLGMALMFYAGNLGAQRDAFAALPVNTDDRPIIEYESPITQREVRAGRGSWLTGDEVVAWYDEITAAVPPASDPFLSRLTAGERGFVEAGRYLFAASTAAAAKRPEEAKRLMAEFKRHTSPEIAARIAQDAETREKQADESARR